MMGGDEILDKLLQLLPDNDNDVSIMSVIINYPPSLTCSFATRSR